MQRWHLLVMWLAFTFTNISYALDNAACTKADKKGINSSIKEFLDKAKSIKYQDIAVISEKCSTDYARVNLHPKNSSTDDAIVYLQKVKGQWQVMELGTYFEPEFLAKIPKELH